MGFGFSSLCILFPLYFTKLSVQEVLLIGRANACWVFWFEERLEIQAIADDITSQYVPPHVNIFDCLGGIPLL